MRGWCPPRGKTATKWIGALLVMVLVAFSAFTFWPRDLSRAVEDAADEGQVSEIVVQVFFPGPELREWSIRGEAFVEDFLAILAGRYVRREALTPGARYGKVDRDPGEPRAVKVHVYQDAGNGRTLTRINFFDGRRHGIVEIDGTSYVLYGDGSRLMRDLLDYAGRGEDAKG